MTPLTRPGEVHITTEFLGTHSIVSGCLVHRHTVACTIGPSGDRRKMRSVFYSQYPNHELYAYVAPWEGDGLRSGYKLTVRRMGTGEIVALEVVTIT